MALVLGPKLRLAETGERAAVAGTNRRSIVAAIALALIMALDIADRNLFGILLVPIQKDLKVSDAAMGALTGIAFSLVYATVAFPMARLADRSVRRNIIAAGSVVWSLMTIVCGAAGKYLTLLVGRIGVGAGQASIFPAMLSMIGDLFPSRHRGKATAALMLGSGVGVALSAYLAGVLSDLYGWRTAFFALAASGLAVAGAFFVTVREPLRGAHDGGDLEDPAAQSWRSSLHHLARTPTVAPLAVGVILVQAVFAIHLAWAPAFLIRVHGLSTAQASGAYGFTSAPALLGILCAGVISDRLAVRGPRWRVIMMIGLLATGVPLFLTMIFAPQLKLTLAMMFCYAFVTGPVASLYRAVALDMARPRMRGTLVAVLQFASMIVGAGLGPVVLGAVNDVVKRTYGDEALRYSLVMAPALIVLAALALLWASRTVDADAEAARAPAART